MGLKAEFTNNFDFFIASELPKLNYSENNYENCVTITPHKILFDYGIKDYEIEVISNPVYHKLFFKTQNTNIPFDLLGASFWLLSRYEEYLPHKTDNFNRFHYKTSIAYQYDFIQIPLVNLWLLQLKKKLKSAFPKLQFKDRNYNFISTIDIDNAYKYKYKGFVRTIAGYFSDLLKKNFNNISSRTKIILTKKEDPFDCYTFLINSNKEFNINAVYFFLLGDYGINDKNHSANNLHFQALIKHLADYSSIGIHPSYGSTNKLQQLKVEVSRLANITHKQILKSRQHFSILKFPHSYQALIQAGINEDFSMGYTNINGFRASYCYPFKWYSMEDELTTALIIHPFAICENTADHLALKEKKNFMETAVQIISEVKKYHGQLISIFHNDAFSERMKKNYLDFLQEAKSDVP